MGRLEANLGKYSAAVTAFRSGLAALDAARALYEADGMPLDPLCRELRITLPTAIVSTAFKGQLHDAVDTPLLSGMFETHPAFRAATAAGTETVSFSFGIPDTPGVCAEVVSATLAPSGRVFCTTNTGASGEWEVIELPPDKRTLLPANALPERDPDPSRRDRCVPDMVAARCAGCGATSATTLQICSACRLVHYCGACAAAWCRGSHAPQLSAHHVRGTPPRAGKKCQTAHWPQHKAACKAARKAAAANAS